MVEKGSKWFTGKHHVNALQGRRNWRRKREGELCFFNYSLDNKARWETKNRTTCVKVCRQKGSKSLAESVWESGHQERKICDFWLWIMIAIRSCEESGFICDIFVFHRYEDPRGYFWCNSHRFLIRVFEQRLLFIPVTPGWKSFPTALLQRTRFWDRVI